MSASNELLLEQIRKLQQELTAAQASGSPTDDIEKRLFELNRQLEASQQALNESKQLLKG